MTTGYILIAAILILGGVIATVGDRIGTRVGKARLSLFKLRPRKTAVVATILTGSIISGSTLAILFAANERLRTGVFELEKIQKDLRQKREQLTNTRQQLETTTNQKSQVESELAQARAKQIEAQNRQAAAQKRLAEINESLQAAIAKQSQTQAQLNRTQAKQSQTQAQLNRTQGQLGQVTSQFQKARALLKTVYQQARVLRSEIQQLQAERQQLIQQRNQVKAQIAKLKTRIAQRDQEIAKLDRTVEQRDRDIAERDQVIAQRETRLRELETQQDYLEREVAKLDQDYQDLRTKNIALERGQVLAAGVVRIVEPSAARQAVEQLLRRANQTIIQFTQPSTNPVNEQVFQIPEEEVEQLIEQINDGRDYVVRIRSAGNYVLGEKRVQVFVEAALNQVVFTSGSVLAAISTDPTTMTAKEIQQRLEVLLGAAKFRALRAGILGDTIQIRNGSPEILIRFFERLQQFNQPVELKVVVAEVTYTAGPLKVELIAVQNGQVVLSTKSVSTEARGTLETYTRPPDSSRGKVRPLTPSPFTNHALQRFLTPDPDFSPTQPVILGFDPGQDKCGLAVMGLDRQLHYHQVILAGEAIATIQALRQKFPISRLVMGDQTTSKGWKQQLNRELPLLSVVMVDERYSSLEARDRYWQIYPPRGFFRLLPRGLRQPPRPVDDIVAIILIERYMERLVD